MLFNFMLSYTEVNHIMFAFLFIETIIIGGFLLAIVLRNVLREDELAHSVGDSPTYTCSMHPEIVRKRPGNCPHCKTMALVGVDSTKPLSNIAKIWQTYRPLIIILSVILVISLNVTMLYYTSLSSGDSSPIMAGMSMSGVSSSSNAQIALFTYNNLMVFMMTFMAGFFLIFGGLKLVNLKAFANRFATYDILAKQWKPYGYVYPFIEIALGVCYVFSIAPRITSIVTIVIMTVGAYGIYQKLRSGRMFTCACLGTKFDIPLTKVTVAENLVMAAMAITMLV